MNIISQFTTLGASDRTDWHSNLYTNGNEKLTTIQTCPLINHCSIRRAQNYKRVTE